MKIFLDENLPKKLKFDFGKEHQVITAREAGWNGMKNGELLSLLTTNGFDAFITIDKNLRHQQNLKNIPLVIFLFEALDNKHTTLQPLVLEILARINKKVSLGIVEIKF